MKLLKEQKWIGTPANDLLFILSPPFFCLLLIGIFPEIFSEDNEVSTFQWIVLVLLIDVAHVYSTIFRTYFDKDVFTKHRLMLVNTPVVCFIAGVILYEFDALIFWRVLAYIAVFHFIRQQYGFLRIYSRNEKFHLSQRIDTVIIYTATIYPMLYWHLSGDRMFEWFIKGDFIIYKQSEILLDALTWCYFIIILIYFIKEIYISVFNQHINIPKTLLITGTLLSWYAGIVYYNGDLTFSLLNVVSHGIPYMALIWFYGRKKKKLGVFSGNNINNLVFGSFGLVLFFFIIFILAYAEEGLWDSLVWNSRKEVFFLFNFLPSITEKDILAFIVPLLALPQLTHYVIDGFIWKIKNDTYSWKETTLG
ncbi:hypothetical protein Solca_2407 [Sporocytophaga myxococcoides]|uniref:Uncharacterized protein n=1 Tax=Sporocytophaga myxococcoides TaxID=153721 RepID=A0A098LD32_9BACT|nr:hypothetical protein [Sporocytophaga myxococcoides]GAL84312.1 hypothetical protein Solca_2407 [Sporocytophaga myxococcoides]